MIRFAGSAFASLFFLSAAAFAAPSDVTVNGKGVFPESLTTAGDGALILGSSSTPVIFRAAPGAATAEPWITLADEGPGIAVSTLGVLADARANTLWACVSEQPAGGPPPPPRHTVLRAFDLKTGAIKASYPLPGGATVCNDIAIGPGHVVYVTDTANARVLRLKPRASALEIWIGDNALAGIDGLTFVGSTLYVNTVTTGHIYRIAVGAGGAAKAPVDIQLSQPLMGPDGMRSAGGKIYVAENRAGQVSVLALHGDKASVTVLKTGYQTPTAVSPMGKTLWIGEAKFNYRRDPDLKDKDPNPFKAYAIPLSP